MQLGKKRKYAGTTLWDRSELKHASYRYWLQDYEEAGRVLFALSKRIIVEPLMGTQEYLDGERKQEIPDDEPEEATKDKIVTYEDLFSDTEKEQGRATLGPEPDRDDDGYLIR